MYKQMCIVRGWKNRWSIVFYHSLVELFSARGVVINSNLQNTARDLLCRVENFCVGVGSFEHTLEVAHWLDLGYCLFFFFFLVILLGSIVMFFKKKKTELTADILENLFCSCLSELVSPKIASYCPNCLNKHCHAPPVFKM